MVKSQKHPLLLIATTKLRVRTTFHLYELNMTKQVEIDLREPKCPSCDALLSKTAEVQQEGCILLEMTCNARARFEKDESVMWKCSNCGYIHEGRETPETCPACDHPQAYYELLAENW